MIHHLVDRAVRLTFGSFQLRCPVRRSEAARHTANQLFRIISSRELTVPRRLFGLGGRGLTLKIVALTELVYSMYAIVFRKEFQEVGRDGDLPPLYQGSKRKPMVVTCSILL